MVEESQDRRSMGQTRGWVWIKGLDEQDMRSRVKRTSSSHCSAYAKLHTVQHRIRKPILRTSSVPF